MDPSEGNFTWLLTSDPRNSRAKNSSLQPMQNFPPNHFNPHYPPNNHSQYPKTAHHSTNPSVPKTAHLHMSCRILIPLAAQATSNNMPNIIQVFKVFSIYHILVFQVEYLDLQVMLLHTARKRREGLFYSLWAHLKKQPVLYIATKITRVVKSLSGPS